MYAMVVLAAEVWTYWMAPPLLAAALALAVAAAVGYYRKVVVPQFLLEQQRHMKSALPSSPRKSEQPLRPPASGDRMPLAA